jgi:hypothetical protein
VNTTDSFQALRRANPRRHTGFTASVEAAREAVSDRIVTASAAEESGRGRSRRFLRPATAGVAVAGVLAAVVAIGDLGGGAGVENAAAAFEHAATVTAATAERSGTAVVRITNGGEEWAGTTIRWNGEDVSIARDHPSRAGKVGDEMRVVGGILYGLDPNGAWLAMGSPRNIDPNSGTTPAEYLAAVRQDVGGVTLQLFSDGLTTMTAHTRDDGSTVYSGRVPAAVVASETGFKEGQPIRVLPFGYVAHGEAADPAALLDATVTVGPDGAVRELSVAWDPAWRFTVTYRGLGATPALEAPAGARPLRERLRSRD